MPLQRHMPEAFRCNLSGAPAAAPCTAQSPHVLLLPCIFTMHMDDDVYDHRERRKERENMEHDAHVMREGK